MTNFPTQQNIYVAEEEDSARWQLFDHRAGDVFICTSPKSGTTWTQAICAFLIFGRGDVPSGNGGESPWVEMTFETMDALNARLNAQTHRRYLKSHSPFDGVIYWPDAIYFSVFRHPLDIYFSLLKHGANQNNPVDNPIYNVDPVKSFEAWLTLPFQVNPNNNTTFEAGIHQYKSFLKWRHLPNIHIFHYADMTRDLDREMVRMAAAMEISHPAELMAELVQAASFDSMKKNADKYAPQVWDGYWKDKREFFNAGTSNKWEGKLTTDQLTAYDARMDNLLTTEERQWLEWGTYPAAISRA